MDQRPTTDIRPVVFTHIDAAWRALDDRLDGLTAEEMRWEPVQDMWSVRPTGDGGGVADGVDVHMETEDPPVTTIAWRMWHLAVDCFDRYSARFVDSTGASVAGADWHLDADASRADLTAAWRTFRDGAAARPDAELWEELGPAWGPFQRHNGFDLLLHAGRELIHHGAEIALLRDLWVHRSAA